VANCVIHDRGLFSCIFPRAKEVRVVEEVPGIARTVYIVFFAEESDATACLELMDRSFSYGFHVVAIRGSDPAALVAYFARFREKASADLQIVIENIPSSMSGAEVSTRLGESMGAFAEDLDLNGETATLTLRTRNAREKVIPAINGLMLGGQKLTARGK
jgi:hypothetical protein